MTVDEKAYPKRIFVERDEETNAKWFTIQGMGVEYIRADAYEAAKPVPASGGVEAAGWLYDQEVGNVFSARWATKWTARQPGEMRGVRNIRQVFTLASSTPPATAPDVGMVEAVREALLGYVLKPGQYETASAFARGQNRVAIDMLGVLDEAAALASSTPAETTDHSGIPGGWGKHMLAEAEAGTGEAVVNLDEIGLMEAAIGASGLIIKGDGKHTVVPIAVVSRLLQLARAALVTPPATAPVIKEK